MIGMLTVASAAHLRFKQNCILSNPKPPSTDVKEVTGGPKEESIRPFAHAHCGRSFHLKQAEKTDRSSIFFLSK